MPLNQADRIAVRSVILSRVTGEVVGYATYLLGLGSATVEQLGWAKGAMDNPGAMADRVSWYVLSDTNYIDLGSGLTDDQLQGAVQTAINNHFIPQA